MIDFSVPLGSTNVKCYVMHSKRPSVFSLLEDLTGMQCLHEFADGPDLQVVNAVWVRFSWYAHCYVLCKFTMQCYNKMRIKIKPKNEFDFFKRS
jgi:hypothetical protein